MTSKLRGNQCPACKKTHEQCADGKACSKWQTSLHVCVKFGTRRAK